MPSLADKIRAKGSIDSAISGAVGEKVKSKAKTLKVGKVVKNKKK